MSQVGSTPQEKAVADATQKGVKTVAEFHWGITNSIALVCCYHFGSTDRDSERDDKLVPPVAWLRTVEQ
jgi:hypothetical protein